jgi:tripartite-type tricarboxylate transporter receptor subunit TctC
MSPVRLALLSFLLVFSLGGLSAETYPDKPIRMLAPVPGGLADIVGRLIAQGISAPLGQQVIVDNRPGVVAIEIAVKSAPDGYTLLMFSPSLWLAPLLGEKVSYDPIRDFVPVTLAASAPSILAVSPSLAAKSVGELITLAKSRPGQLNYASGPSGGTPHLAMELFNSLAGIRITRVPYRGSAQALTALIAGETQVMIAPVVAGMAAAKSNRLRALAVTSARPSALAPGLQPLAEVLPGYESASIAGIFAPQGTPASIVERLNREIVRVLSDAAVKEKLFNIGGEAIGSTPQEFGATVKADMARMGKIIRQAGIREE